MMRAAASSNPYQPALREQSAAAAPFVGRQAALARLQQFLNAPTQGEALAISGQRKSGKTALIHHAASSLADHPLSVYMPLRPTSFNTEHEFWAHWMRRIEVTITERRFAVERLPQIPDAGIELGQWIAANWLPELWSIIRPYRMLMPLLDDADVLINLVRRGLVSREFCSFFHDLLLANPRMKVVLTVSAQEETNLSFLAPMVNLSDVIRLNHLTKEESALLLREPVRGLYDLTDQSVSEIHKAMGGLPLLTQHSGYCLFEQWQQQKVNSPITTSEAKAIIPLVYDRVQGELDVYWQELTANERSVLNAIAQMIYENPIRAFDTAAIEAWLVDSESPIDATAINAAVRGLEYRELISAEQGGIKLTTGLMQKWLLENTTRKAITLQSRPGFRHLGLIVLAILVLTAVVVLIISLTRAPQPSNSPQPEPTVTLVAPTSVP